MPVLSGQCHGCCCSLQLWPNHSNQSAAWSTAIHCLNPKTWRGSTLLDTWGHLAQMLLAMQPPSLQLSFVVSGKQVEPSYSDQYSQPLLTKSWKWAQTVPSWKEGRSYLLQLHRLRWSGKALSHSSINALQPGLQTKIMFRKTTTSLVLQDHHWANSPIWRKWSSNLW
jgi:hypothetical protein